MHTDHETRVRHTRGKSTPDLLRMRAGDGSDAPDVGRAAPPTTTRSPRSSRWCSEHRVALVPFGGGTSVVGGLAARRDGFAGVVSLDLRRLDRLVSVDAESGTAVLEAGLLGPRAEALLAEHGLTLGHFPQSFEYASIGGFAATRSSGQASSGYGRFDALVVGLTVATPLGTLDARQRAGHRRRPRPARAGARLRGRVRRDHVGDRAGPPGTHGEGVRRLAVRLVRARARPRSATLAQAGAAPTVLRLSDENETAINLAKPDEVGGASGGGCLMIAGYEGERATVDLAPRRPRRCG